MTMNTSVLTVRVRVAWWASALLYLVWRARVRGLLSSGMANRAVHFLCDYGVRVR